MKKTSFTRKLTALLCAVAMMITAFNVVPAKAAGGYISGLGLKADASVGTTYSFKHGYAGIKKAQTMKIAIDDLKVLKADKEGYNKMIYTVTFRDTFNPAQKQVDAIMDAVYKNNYADVWGSYWTAVVDDNTGLCVMKNKDFEMETVTVDEDRNLYFRDDGAGGWISNVKFSKWCVTVTYPETYDNLVIGFGAQKKIAYSKADDKFWESKVPFGKTTYYKKNKKCSKWIKVSDYVSDEKDNGQYDYMSEVAEYDIKTLANNLKSVENYMTGGMLDMESYLMDNGFSMPREGASSEDTVAVFTVYGNWTITVDCADKNGTTTILLENNDSGKTASVSAKISDPIEVKYTDCYTSKSFISEKLPLIIAYVLKYPFGDMPGDISELGLEQM